MGIHKNKTYPLRIDNDLRLKVQYLADKENRKLSNQFELIISKFIDDYEAENGIIQIIDNEPSAEVKAYIDLITNDRMTIDNVPQDLQAQVNELLRDTN